MLHVIRFQAVWYGGAHNVRPPEKKKEVKGLTRGVVHGEGVMHMKCSSVGRPSDQHAANAGSIPQYSNLSSVYTPPCACIYICARVKDPVVHVRVQWIMEILKQPACPLGWVA